MDSRVKIGMKIKKKLFAVFIIMLIIFIFAPKAYADQSTEIINLYYYEFDDNGQEYFVTENHNIPKNMTDEEKAFLMFKKLLHNDESNFVTMIPEQTEVLFCYIENNTLVVNFSKEFLDYSGSTAEGIGLVKQIAKNVENISNVEYLTFLVEGMFEVMPEGSIIYKSDIKTIIED